MEREALKQNELEKCTRSDLLYKLPIQAPVTAEPPKLSSAKPAFSSFRLPPNAMNRTTTKAFRRFRHIRRLYSSCDALPSVQTIAGPLASIDVGQFREKAFDVELPLLIAATGASTPDGGPPGHCIPAADKWFKHEPSHHGNRSSDTGGRLVLNQAYLSQFRETILPFELVLPDPTTKPPPQHIAHDVDLLLRQLLQRSSGGTFHRFTAPLDLFLLASSTPALWPPALYIAQAQLIDLPPALRDDLPTPRLVLEAGKGDVYDSNVWLGIPPTYTPLHRDPNPNLFVQLASQKRVRLFSPDVGDEIFRSVRQKLSGRETSASMSMRGEEMMQGPENTLLREAVWGRIAHRECFEAVVKPGDALFIPKKWWHSFVSKGEDVTASVNWWFR